MEAVRLQPVQIMCVLTTTQIEQMVSQVSSYLPAQLDDLNDIDELVFNDSFRMCVDFDIDALGNVKVLCAEVLNRDWDVLESDSFAFSQYLEPVIQDYNKSSKELTKQEEDIRNERIYS